MLINLPARAFAQQDTLAVIPFFVKQQKIYFKCRVNNSDSLTFLFDTGASPMVITDSIALNQLKMVMDSQVENQGANGVSTVKASTNNQLMLGGITLAASGSYLFPTPAIRSMAFWGLM